MPSEREMRLLSMADVLEPLSNDEIEEIARTYRDVRLGPGEVLFSPGEHAGRVYILKEGRVLVYRIDPGGTRWRLPWCRAA